MDQAQNIRDSRISLRDSLIAISVVALWGLHVVIIRIGALEIPPLLLLSLRFTLVIVLMAPFFKPLPFSRIKPIFFYAVTYMVLHLGFVFVGLKYVESSIGGLVLQTEVPFGIVLACIFFKERFGLRTALGLVLAFIGVLIIVYQPAGSITQLSYFGVGCLIASAFFWAVGALLMRFVGDVNFTSMTFYSHFVALPFVAALSFFLEDNQWSALQNADHYKVGGVLVYQVFLMSGCLYMWKNLMVRNKAYEVTCFSLLQPVFAVFFAVLILGENLEMKTILGGLVALAGVGVVTFRQMQKQEDTSLQEEESPIGIIAEPLGAIDDIVGEHGGDSSEDIAENQTSKAHDTK